MGGMEMNVRNRQTQSTADAQIEKGQCQDMGNNQHQRHGHESCPDEEAIMKQVIEQSVERAVKKTFAILGVDINDPESVEEFRQDLRFGKRMRKMADHGQLALVAMFFMGLGWALYEGIKAKLGMHS
jgi:hypothetical protein